MMTTRTIPPLSTPKANHIFAEVFPKSVIRPPKRQEPSRKYNLSLGTIKALMIQDSRLALGIELDHDDATFSKLTTFQPHFADMHDSNIGLDDITVDTSRYISSIQALKSWKYLPSWTNVFGATRLERLFAAVIDESITAFVSWSYGGVHQDFAVKHLHCWVDNFLYPYTSVFLNRLNGLSLSASTRIDSSQIQRWRDMALTRLADLRVAELFEIVVELDSKVPAIDELKHFASNTATRSYTTVGFSATLSRRLLHPGASTIEILQVYISIIRAFRQLDSKGVLLERVARKLRRYLRDREDTIKVVVAGLLADVSEDAVQQDPDVLAELAVELQQRSNNDTRGQDADLDWNNIGWVPDPIDAAPDHMKSKNTDVIGSLISLFDTKDVFVKELQVMLADRLLKTKAHFDQEIGVVEHLKIRFGDSTLQGCEVMLRDVSDSRKVDQIIRQDQKMNATETSETPEIHTKILSRLFWPSLQEQTFKVPSAIMDQQTKYEKGFESLKQSRKLTWLNAIGTVEVHLDLEDRTIQEEVTTWQASVIHAFEANSTRTVSQLESELEMTPALVRSACMFWAAKRVLAETTRNTFTVLETLPTGGDVDVSNDANGALMQAQPSDAAIAAAAEMAAQQAAQEAEEADRKQKMAIYHQFIISMLTNQGSMPLPRIAMMLGIVVPGGFPFGNEELREFLNGMVKDGVLEHGNGGAYKVAS